MYLGIDIGGTKTLIATLSDDGEIVDSRRFPTNKDYDDFINDLGENLKQLPLESASRVCAAVPGLLDRQAGTVHVLGNLPWRDEPVRDDISRLVGGLPTIIENDARLGGLYEALLVQNQYRNVLFLTVSTGIGGALIENGRIVLALQDMEVGKMPLLHNGELVYWEDFAGGRSVVQRFHKNASEIADPKEWRQVGESLAYGLAPLCSVLQPEVIILGGSVGAYADKYQQTVLTYLEDRLHPIIRLPKAILAAQRPDEAVIYGCYALIKQQEEDASIAG